MSKKKEAATSLDGEGNGARKANSGARKAGNGKSKAASGSGKAADGGVNEMVEKLKELAKLVEQKSKLDGTADAENKVFLEFLYFMVEDLEMLTHSFNLELGITSNMTGKERQRLTSARVRNNGFIDKAFDVARDNPTFLPPHFNAYALNWKMREFELLRQIMACVDQLQRSVQDAFIIQANDCFGDAIRIYRSLQEQMRSGVPGAASLFDVLSIYFANRRRATTEPTEKQLERDVKRLIKGKADGEIVIRNEKPKTSGGIHEVVDNVRTGRSAVKASVEEEVDEGTSGRKK